MMARGFCPEPVGSADQRVRKVKTGLKTWLKLADDDLVGADHPQNLAGLFIKQIKIKIVI